MNPLVWNRRTPTHLRAYGIDFGPFALVVLMDVEPASLRQLERDRTLILDRLEHGNPLPEAQHELRKALARHKARCS